jgi:hypothetical protein
LPQFEATRGVSNRNAEAIRTLTKHKFRFSILSAIDLQPRYNRANDLSRSSLAPNQELQTGSWKCRRTPSSLRSPLPPTALAIQSAHSAISLGAHSVAS